MELSGKIAIVTGAKQGLGKAIALGLAEAGADIVVCTRVVEDGKLADVADEIKVMGRRSLALRADVTKETDVDNLVQRVIDDFGRIDILVNNAGVTAPDSFIKIPRRRWNLILSVNLNGTFLCTHAVLPHMVEQGHGTIINVSSILAKEIKYSIPYGVSKAAIERFTLGLAREMRREKDIAITCIRPYFIKTEVVEGFLPDADTSDWETTEMWSKYTAMVAAASAQEVTGKILDQAALQKLFGEVK